MWLILPSVSLGCKRSILLHLNRRPRGFSLFFSAVLDVRGARVSLLIHQFFTRFGQKDYHRGTEPHRGKNLGLRGLDSGFRFVDA